MSEIVMYLADGGPDASLAWLVWGVLGLLSVAIILGWAAASPKLRGGAIHRDAEGAAPARKPRRKPPARDRGAGQRRRTR